MDAKLRVLSGPHAGETIQIPTGKLLIGREEDCHLRPESEFVSRHHCVLLLDEYTLRVRDLASKNGTFVNARRIGSSETILLHDDMVAIGEMICQIDLGPIPTGGPGPVSPNEISAAIHGTKFFDGDTVQTESPDAVPNLDPHVPIPVPFASEVPAAPPHETQTLDPPGS